MFLDVTSLNEGSSDHNPLLITVGNVEEEPVEEKTNTDWNKFRHVLRVKEELEQAAKELEDKIHQALKGSAVKKKKTTKRSCTSMRRSQRR